MERQVILAIVMVGSAPIFYRIVVTAALLDTLVTSTYPAEPTTILKYIPLVPNHGQYTIGQGMQPSENHHIVFQLDCPWSGPGQD